MRKIKQFRLDNSESFDFRIDNMIELCYLIYFKICNQFILMKLNDILKKFVKKKPTCIFANIPVLNKLDNAIVKYPKQVVVVCALILLSLASGTINFDTRYLTANQLTFSERDEMSSPVFDNLPSRPDRPIIAFHFVLRFMTLDEAKSLIDKVDASRYNTVIMQLTHWWVDFNRAPWGEPLDDITPLTRAEFVELVEYTKKKNIDIIPEIKLFTHQEKLFSENHPDLMFNSRVYDPRKEEVYEHVVPFMSEIISIIRPYAIHIWHDEIPKYTPNPEDGTIPSHSLKRPDEPTPNGELFKISVNRLQDIITKRWWIETWIWWDMLIHPDEFPNMYPVNLHADRWSWYGKALRDGLTKDITVVDWHYFGNTTKFSSGLTMKQEGFDVLGAPWKDQNLIENYAKWAAENDYSGMVATSWQHAFPHRKDLLWKNTGKTEWEILNETIRDSGRIFREYFNPKVFENLPTRPEGPVIAFHYVARGMDLDLQKSIIDRVANAWYNTVILQITQGFDLEQAPWKPLPDALSREEFVELVDYIKGKDLQLIPELKLFTHQEKFLDRTKPEHAALMFNSKTYDPRKEEVYDIVIPLISEIISIVRPYAFHVGHDEVAYYQWKDDKGEPINAFIALREDEAENIAHGSLYKISINRLEETITRRWGIETWIWWDMLLHPNEFPTMFKPHLNGATGKWFGKTLRNSITKNLTVIDFHYFDSQDEFPSGLALRESGFDVLWSTWWRDDVAKRHTKWAGDNNYSGMVSTSWKNIIPGDDYDADKIDWFIEGAAREYLKHIK